MRSTSPGQFSFEGNSSPLAKNIESFDTMNREFESFCRSSPHFNDKFRSATDKQSPVLSDITNRHLQTAQPAALISQDGVSIEEERQEVGKAKIQELGETIRNSLCSIQLKFCETKTSIEKAAAQNGTANWDEKLSKFYEDLFTQAKEALFTAVPAILVKGETSTARQQSRTPAKSVTPVGVKKKPISCLKFNVFGSTPHTQGSSNSSSTSNCSNTSNRGNNGGSTTQRAVTAKPSSVQKFSVRPSLSQSTPTPHEGAKGGVPATTVRQRSLSVSKFPTTVGPTASSKQTPTAKAPLPLLSKSRDIKKEALPTTNLRARNSVQAGLNAIKKGK